MRFIDCLTAGLSLAVVFYFVQYATATDLPAVSDARPNIVWLMSEDNSIHYLDHFFPGGADTPTIKDLASDGITFTNAYSNAPVCSVARTTLITGCYAPRLATQYHRRSQMIDLSDDLKMFPAYLRSAGYYTTNNSKEDYNAVGSKDAWDDSSRKASWRNRPTPETSFFHVQTFTDSHESSLHFDVSTLREVKTSHDPESIESHPYLPDTPLVRYTHARYLDRIQLIDRKIADVVSQLKADGVWENTIVFYFGDHGGVLPRSKGYVYDTGLHVPLVIRIPAQYRQAWNVDAGSTDQRFVEFVDFGPTVLSLAGVQTPEAIDGDPFLGSYAASDDHFETALGYADRFDEKYDLVRSLHKGRFHYIRNYQPFYPDSLYNEYRYKMLAYSQWKNMHQQSELTPTQAAFFQPRPVEMLFDTASDPFEVNNLVGNDQYSKVVGEMRAELRGRLKQLPDLSFLTEPVCVPAAANAVATYANSQRSRISKLIDIADTCLLQTDENKQLLRSAVASPDPMERFWAATSIASFAGSNGQRLSIDIYDQCKLLLQDADPMVRTRAAEAFLVLSGVDPTETFVECLRNSRNATETLWIMNAIAFARDSYPNERLSGSLKLEVRHQGGEIERRLKYFSQPSNQ